MIGIGAEGKKAPVVMATRISAERHKDIIEILREKEKGGGDVREAKFLLKHLVYHTGARILSLSPSMANATSKDGLVGSIAVLSAGTADHKVAEEVAVVAELCNTHVHRVYDVGVAGIHRLFRSLSTIRGVQVVVCVAGMDGALPTVVAGLVQAPVIAVPTSVGYGIGKDGIAPLLTMLNGCAPGLAVVNIDNGFGAATMAIKILKSYQQWAAATSGAA